MAARLPRAFSLAARSARPALARPVLPVARFASTEAGPSQTPAQTPAPATPAESAEKQPEPEPTKSSDSGKDVKDVNGKGKDENDDPYAVPPLSRPPGVTLRPSSAPLTWQRKKELMLDQERHKAKRKALMKEARQGYFHDYNLARKGNGGKLWVAPPVLIRDDRALYFPDIKGKSLNGVETHTTDLFAGNISLVSILNTRISEEHAQGFVGPVLEDWEGTPHFRHVQINHQENPLKSMLVSFFASSLKRTVPQQRWDTYLISSGEWSEIDITGPLGIENKLLGYVFLVDQNAKIRWAACGDPRQEEIEDLRRCAAVLVRRMSEDKDK